MPSSKWSTSATLGSRALGLCLDGMCVLQCGADEDCPEGMLCAGTDLRDSMCAWASDDPFVCAESNAGSEGDPCETIGDESTCNATVSDSHGDRCLWLESIIVPTQSSSCEPAATQARCVHVREGAGSCTDHDVCGSSRVLWNDLGAGTAEILALACDRDLRSGAGTSCDFGSGTGIPLACACGCPD